MNFIRTFLSLRENTEVPGHFCFWSAVSGLASCLGRSAWLDMSNRWTLYPNFFIVLVAGSGRLHKSTAIDWMEDLLHEVSPPLNIISQKLSPEKLITALHPSKSKDLTEGVIVVDELSIFLNRNSYIQGLGTLLIPLMDCKKHYSYDTHIRGKEKLNNCCLNVLSATTPHSLHDDQPTNLLGSGLSSRMIFAHVSKPEPPVGLPPKDDKWGEKNEQLLEHLNKVRLLQGQFKVPDEVFEKYDEDHKTWCNENEEWFNDPFRTGYASRRSQHILRLAMVFAVSEDPKLEISLDHYEGAKLSIEESERNMNKIVRYVTGTEEGRFYEAIKAYIRAKGRISKTNLTKAFAHQMKRREMNEHLDTLIEAGEVVARPDGGRIFYLCK